MQKSLLAQLREMTVVVADTGDIQAIEKFRPQDATTNPSLITTAAQMPEYQQIVDDVLLGAKQDLGKDAKNADVTRLAFERLAIAFGKKILGIIKGRVSTEVDARLSYDTGKTLATARSIMRARAYQDRFNLERHQSSRRVRERRHSLQLDVTIRNTSGDCMCRCGRDPRIAVCRADSRLVQEGHWKELRRS
jgi:hypothetical protein